MENIIQVCCSKSEIKGRIDRFMPELRYELEGMERDYALMPYPSSTEELIELRRLFEDVTYGGGRLTLAETLVETLKDSELAISFAESCTGGMLTSAVVDVSGASEVLYEGIICYSNESKIRRLGVKGDTVCDSGAVSAETAIEMANGLLQNTDIGVSVTGIAGPEGGTFEKPVGLVYIAVISDNHTDVYEEHFAGNRRSIRNQAKNTALFYALQHIKKYFN